MTLQDGFPPFYAERSSEALMPDEALFLIFSICVLILAMVIILPGFRSWERLLFLLHWSFTLLVGGSILASVFGVHWHVSEVTTEIPFLKKQKEVMNATVGLKIGLHSFNVTLEGMKDGVKEMRLTEKYFFLTTDEQMEEALRRGMPSPILNVVEHFSGNRISSVWPWSRRYWIIGHFSSYLLWAAFAFWLLFNLIIHAVVKYGCLCLSIVGVLMELTCITFSSINRYGQPMVTVGYYSETAFLKFQFGWSFWLCFAVGLICIFWSVFLLYQEKTNKKAVRLFFNIENGDENEFNEAVQVYVHSRRNSTVGGSVTSEMIQQINSKSLLQKLQNLDKNHLSVTNDAFEPEPQEKKYSPVFEKRKITFKDERPLRVEESTLSVPTIVVNDLSE